MALSLEEVRRAAALARLRLSPAEEELYAGQLARNGLERSRDRFDWGRITDSLEEVYRSAIGLRRAGVCRNGVAGRLARIRHRAGHRRTERLGSRRKDRNL